MTGLPTQLLLVMLGGALVFGSALAYALYFRLLASAGADRHSAPRVWVRHALLCRVVVQAP